VEAITLSAMVVGVAVGVAVAVVPVQSRLKSYPCSR